MPLDSAALESFRVADGHRRFWNSEQALREYAAARWRTVLFLGERLAFDFCFRNGASGQRVLDLGCGAGRTTAVLHRMGAAVTGADLSAALIGAARQNERSIPFVVADAARLNFQEGAFDAVVFSYNGLDCLFPKTKRLEAIREVARVLRTGGKFILSHHNSAAFLCGPWNFLRPFPQTLLFCLRHIWNGDALRRECYFSNPNDSQGVTYYNGHPRAVIADMRRFRFESVAVFPNSFFLWSVQRILGTDHFTRLMDPWPYYVFEKR